MTVTVSIPSHFKGLTWESRALSTEMPSRPPLVLIASGQEWGVRALQSTLGPQGYAVLRSFNARQVFEQAKRARVDLAILSDDFQDGSAIDVCRTLRREKLVTDSTGILLVAPAPISHEVRIAALRAGASDCLGLPMDSEELGLRLKTYVRAKFDSDLAKEAGLIDIATGLYNAAGTARRARELGSLAFRHSTPMACVVFSAESEASSEPVDLTDAIRVIAEALSQDGRVSDAIGRMGENEIAVFAPETDTGAAELLAQRLQRAVNRRSAAAGARSPRLKTGVFAVPNYRLTPLEPAEMLRRASAAMREGSPAAGRPVWAS